MCNLPISFWCNATVMPQTAAENCLSSSLGGFDSITLIKGQARYHCCFIAFCYTYNSNSSVVQYYKVSSLGLHIGCSQVSSPPSEQDARLWGILGSFSKILTSRNWLADKGHLRHSNSINPLTGLRWARKTLLTLKWMVLLLFPDKKSARA